MNTSKKDEDIVIIGAGCAGLSLARALGQRQVAAKLIGPPSPALTTGEHIWGFWGMDWLADAKAEARHHWQHWQFADANQVITQSSNTHPYFALSSADWLRNSAKVAATSVRHDQRTFKEYAERGISLEDGTMMPAQQAYDSRPLPVRDGAMLQHFLGIEIKLSEDRFDETTAILMDFRVDQSRGLHFIYLLPFSKSHALIEATMFTPQVAPAGFYETAITSYLKEQFNITSYRELRREVGVIPMQGLAGKPSANAIGARSGAVRPSSGYAFSFIQKQVQRLADKISANPNADHAVPAAHHGYDLWMDKVFLQVLKTRPDLSVGIFMGLASALRGGEMARFMSGNAALSTYLKVVFAMPIMAFVKASIQVTFAKMLGRNL